MDHKISECLIKQTPMQCFIKELHFKERDSERLKANVWTNIQQVPIILRTANKRNYELQFDT